MVERIVTSSSEGGPPTRTGFKLYHKPQPQKRDTNGIYDLRRKFETRRVGLHCGIIRDRQDIYFSRLRVERDPAPTIQLQAPVKENGSRSRGGRGFT